EAQIPVLIAEPLAEMVLGRNHCQQRQQGDAQSAEGARAIAEQQSADFFEQAHSALQGHTQPQPAPRKKVPMTVRIVAAVRNQDIIQNGRGFERSHCRNLPGAVAGNASRSISAAINSVGTSTAQTSKN